LQGKGPVYKYKNLRISVLENTKVLPNHFKVAGTGYHYRTVGPAPVKPAATPLGLVLILST